jgi:hypothetical protein
VPKNEGLDYLSGWQVVKFQALLATI